MPATASQQAKIDRIHALDAKFEHAMGWGSWMAGAASERRGLVRELAHAGIHVDHKWQCQTGHPSD